MTWAVCVILCSNSVLGAYATGSRGLCGEQPEGCTVRPSFSLPLGNQPLQCLGATPGSALLVLVILLDEM